MSTAGLLLDEMLSPAIAVALRDLGHDAIGVVESAAYRGMPDDQVLELALLEERGLVTSNISDFAQLDTRWRAAARIHPGVVYVAAKRFPADRAFVGAVVTALDVGLRARVLPVVGQTTFL